MWLHEIPVGGLGGAGMKLVAIGGHDQVQLWMGAPGKGDQTHAAISPALREAAKLFD